MKVAERFHSGLVLDGGLATELERRGEDLKDSLWSARLLLDNPKLISQVHTDYLEAGADVITSASYQCSFEGLETRGLSKRESSALMLSSITIARESVERFWTNSNSDTSRLKPLVAASLGSYGATLADGSEFTGKFNLNTQQLKDWHRLRFEVMRNSSADLIAFETIPSMIEAEGIFQLLEESPEVLAWISFTCRDQRHTGGGDLFLDIVKRFQSLPNIMAIGINCTAPGLTTGLLESLQLPTNTGKVSFPNIKPLIVYPNSGEIWDGAHRCWRPDDGNPPFDWSAAVQTWWRLGARGIGGCCRTTPETIRQIAKAVAVVKSYHAF